MTADAGLAQPVERRAASAEVPGSTPGSRSLDRRQAVFIIAEEYAAGMGKLLAGGSIKYWPANVTVVGIFGVRHVGAIGDGDIVVLIEADADPAMPWDGALVDPVITRGDWGNFYFHGFDLRLGRYAR